MRIYVLLAALALASGYEACGRTLPDAAAPTLSGLGAPESDAAAQATSHVDFDTQVRPLLQSRCTPCHFEGGTMYERLPFDRPETVRKLGTKLFTRIKDEKERQLIRDFLAQPAEPGRERP